jgi:hypothetical protein
MGTAVYKGRRVNVERKGKYYIFSGDGAADICKELDGRELSNPSREFRIDAGHLQSEGGRDINEFVSKVLGERGTAR